MKQLFKDKKYWKDMALILLFGVLVNIACFCMPMIGHCTNESSQYFPMTQNDKGFPMSEIFSYVSADFQHNENLNDYYCFMSCSDDLSGRYHGYIIFTDSMWLAEQNSSGSSFNAQSSTVQNVFYSYEYQCSNTFSWKNVWPRGSNTIRGINFESSLFNEHMSYLSNFQIGFYVYDYACLIGPDNTVSVGDFVDLPNIDEILNDIQNTWEPPSTTTGHALPSAPTENPNNTPFQDRLQMFDYLKDSINSIIGNLGYNLKKWIDSLTGKIIDGANSVSQNVWNGFKTLMDNIKDFFGPKLDSINDSLGQLVDHISQDEEESQQEIQSALHGTTFYQDFDDMKELVTDSVAIWNSTSAPSEYKIPFHVERIEILNCDEVQYIDLSLFSPVFPYLRGVMWALVTYSLVYTVIDSIASYISGGDE